MFDSELNLPKLCIWELAIDFLTLLDLKTKNVFWKHVITYWCEYQTSYAGEKNVSNMGGIIH